MQLPTARGPLSEFVVGSLRGYRPEPRPDVLVGGAVGDDFHLALYLCYENHYTDIEAVDPALEWDPSLIEFRSRLETAFERRLRELVPARPSDVTNTVDAVVTAIENDDGPSLARFIETDADTEQVKEFVIHRSAYHLKEADPHTWAIPRLRGGGAKAAFVEIQADEYGGGRGERIHSVLFAKTMNALGLDPTYGAYVDQLPGVTLATVNLMTMFGLNRRLRGACIGHLAAFETTSAEPNRRYAAGLRRLGFSDEACDFFDEHVEADSVHEVIAIHDLVGGFVSEQPNLAADVVWGARCLLTLDREWAEQVLGSWAQGRSSLFGAVEHAGRP